MPGVALLENSSNSSLLTKRVSPEGGISKLRPRAAFVFFGLRGGVGCWVLVAVTAGGNIASAKSQPTGPNMQPKVVWWASASVSSRPRITVAIIGETAAHPIEPMTSQPSGVML